jgi:uncharacterized membrane protein
VETTPTPQNDAPFLERLPKELEAWQKDNLIREDQAQALLARYGLLAGETSRTLHRSRMVSILAVLGVLLVGAGVILLIGANWQAIPKWTRLLLLILATAAVYFGGYRMTYKSKSYPKVGLALLLLGSIFWGASIFLIGQMYQLGGFDGGGERQAVLYWFIGVLPLAYALLSPLHLILSLALGTIWLFMTIGEFHAVLGEVVMLYFLAIGILLYALGRLHSGWQLTRKLDIPYYWLGLLYIFSVLYGFSFKGMWSIPRYHFDMPPWLWLGLLLGAGGAATVTLFIASTRRDKAALFEALGLLFLLALGITLALIISTYPQIPETTFGYPYVEPHTSIPVMAFFNLLLFAATIGLIILGWARSLPGLINFGLLVFFVQVFARYFDLIKNMRTSGLIFVGAGLLLIFMGVVLERSRRKLLAGMAQRRLA